MSAQLMEAVRKNIWDGYPVRMQTLLIPPNSGLPEVIETEWGPLKTQESRHLADVYLIRDLPKQWWLRPQNSEWPPFIIGEGK